jgi:hypothetical protein
VGEERALISRGSAGTGAGIGAIVNGKNGALISAALGWRREPVRRRASALVPAHNGSVVATMTLFPDRGGQEDEQAAADRRPGAVLISSGDRRSKRSKQR